jgi:hypothetical protein
MCMCAPSKLSCNNPLNRAPPLCLLFVDYKKVFDCVDREYIWTALSYLGILLKIINLRKEFYKKCNCQVMERGLIFQPFKIRSAVC